MHSRICRRHAATKVYLFTSVGTKEYFMTWFWLRWSPSRCMLHWVSYMCSLHAPSCRSCRSWMDVEQAGGIPLFNGCKLMAVFLVMKMWRWCAGSLCGCVGVHVFIGYRAAVTLWTAVYKGFPWKRAPQHCSRGTTEWSETSSVAAM